jgi:hypothetical protein
MEPGSHPWEVTEGPYQVWIWCGKDKEREGKGRPHRCALASVEPGKQTRSELVNLQCGGDMLIDVSCWATYQHRVISMWIRNCQDVVFYIMSFLNAKYPSKPSTGALELRCCSSATLLRAHTILPWRVYFPAFAHSLSLSVKFCCL